MIVNDRFQSECFMEILCVFIRPPWTLDPYDNINNISATSNKYNNNNNNNNNNKV